MFHSDETSPSEPININRILLLQNEMPSWGTCEGGVRFAESLSALYDIIIP